VAYLVTAKDGKKENDITIECSDMQDMVNYALACKEQGYTEVNTINTLYCKSCANPVVVELCFTQKGESKC
jgi:hypothetical protein